MSDCTSRRRSPSTRYVASLQSPRRTRSSSLPSPPGMSALALLVAHVLADHHDPPVPTDHLALVADLLDARLDLHGSYLLLVPVDDSTAGEVVGGELDDDPVLREDADVVLPHLAADVRQ